MNNSRFKRIFGQRDYNVTYHGVLYTHMLALDSPFRSTLMGKVFTKKFTWRRYARVLVYKLLRQFPDKNAIRLYTELIALLNTVGGDPKSLIDALHTDASHFIAGASPCLLEALFPQYRRIYKKVGNNRLFTLLKSVRQTQSAEVDTWLADHADGLYPIIADDDVRMEFYESFGRIVQRDDLWPLQLVLPSVPELTMTKSTPHYAHGVTVCFRGYDTGRMTDVKTSMVYYPRRGYMNEPQSGILTRSQDALHFSYLAPLDYHRNLMTVPYSSEASVAHAVLTHLVFDIAHIVYEYLLPVPLATEVRARSAAARTIYKIDEKRKITHEENTKNKQNKTKHTQKKKKNDNCSKVAMLRSACDAL